MKKAILLSAMLYACLNLHAQQAADTTIEKNLDEITVYTNKFAEKKKYIAQKIDVITATSIAKLNGQNTGDLLVNTGNIFVQKSQQGGSSPVLRGFEASRVLLVVDGIRLNNAIYRSGHLQSAITVDQNMLERVEVLYGPASTIYGSDALGGVIHFRTKAPLLSGSNKLLTRGTSFVRYSTINKEKTGHVDFSIGGQKFAALSSFTYSDFGDVKMGSNYLTKYPDFGKRLTYIQTENGIDNVVANEDERLQIYSAYKQWDITQKFLFRQNDKIAHSVNLQYSSSTDVPRYDRLQDTRNFGGSIGTTLRWAEWYYGPQTRILAAYELNVVRMGFFNDFRINVNYQDVKESRQQREYRRYDRFDSRREHIKVAAFNIDGRKIWKRNELTLGADGQLNVLTSVADRTNLTTGVKSKLDSRYPNGDNKMNFLGLYAQHLFKSKNGKLVLNDGLRIQYVSLHSIIADNSFFNFPFTEIKQSPLAVTGNLGLILLPGDEFRITANVSSGFRAPNIDDAARVFESASATRRLIVPNQDVAPEYTYNFDFGFSYKIEDMARIEFTGFYTLFRNAVALAPFKLNGQDSVLYNSIVSAVYANQNVNKAYLRGMNARVLLNLSKKLAWDNTISHTFGRYVNPDGSKKPMDHIPPVFGKSGITYSSGKLSWEAWILFNGWKRMKDYNPDGEDNGQYATPDGMPSWLTLNYKAGYTINKNVTIQLGIENITDRNYRYFASGFSAPGRNFYASLRVNW
jgi:hemoglobin/transferrin/lactoferrin receptor protein